MSESFDRVVARLEQPLKKLHSGDVKGKCPVPSHGKGRGDRDPSLHVTDDGDKVLVKCLAGCHVQDVLLALGLDYPDLFDNIDRDHLVASYIYEDRNGRPYHVNERWQTKGGKRFRQHMADSDKPGLRGNKPALYHLPKVLAQAADGGPIYWVEGEKCVHAAESIGLVATCATNGVSGWRDYYPVWLKGASEVVVVTDNDEAGKAYAAMVVNYLRAAGIKSRAMRVKPTGPKDDLYDHVAAGYDANDLIDVNLTRQRPEGCPMDDLLRKDFPPVRFAVDDLIAAGLTLLGGAPKIGKSYIAQDIALGVALGSNCLSHLPCQQGSVLYLALDNDTERRVKERTQYILAGQDIRHIPMEVHTEWPTGAAALSAVQEWTNETDNPLMVIVDTLVRIEPEFEGNGRENAYAASTNVLSRWAKFAITNNIAVVAVHHDKKGETDDWMDKFTGSRGITATAQTLLFVQAKRGEKVGMLRVTGRDIETDDLELMRYGRTWVAASKPQEVQGTPVLHLVQ